MITFLKIFCVISYMSNFRSLDTKSNLDWTPIELFVYQYKEFPKKAFYDPNQLKTQRIQEHVEHY